MPFQPDKKETGLESGCTKYAILLEGCGTEYGEVRAKGKYGK